MNQTQTTLEQIRSEAEAAHAIYPQYRNYWDGWVLGKLTMTIRSKLGVAGKRGEVVLMDPKVEILDGIECRTFYSRSNQINTVVAARKVRSL